MKKILSVMVALSMALMTSCGPNNSTSGPTSAEGSWTYTTPDSKISVTFDLVKNASGTLDIQNQVMKFSGTTYQSGAEIMGVVLPTIGQIRIVANDAKLVYPYYISFTNGKVSADFTSIDVPDVEYTYSGGSNTLKSISIKRP